jgi:hypothetical protein
MKVGKDNEVKMTFRFPLDIAKDLKYKSIDENTPVNALVIKAVKGFLKK